jgi:TPR repeat protein
VVKDPVEGAKWYRQAAERGNVQAQVKLGLDYAAGKGLVANSTEAVKWFGYAAGANDTGAQFFLGLCYANGDGVPKDEIEALAWFDLSATAGNGSAVKSRDLLEQKLGWQKTRAALERSKEILKEIGRNQATH